MPRPLAPDLFPPAPAADDDVDIDALVLSHLPLVGHCVGEVMSRVPSHVDRDDLAGAGVEGLLQAARSWRPETGVPFSAHARTRIRGAIVDELRAGDWASRGARSRARQTAQTTEHLAGALGRSPSDTEVADALGVAPSHVHKVRAETHRSYLTSLEEAHASEDGERSVHDSVRDPGMSPEDHVVLADHLGRLRHAVDLLPARVREAVRGHYLDEEPMAAIAARLGVTESRVSQLRAEGVAMLRQVMQAQEELDRATADAVPLRAEPDHGAPDHAAPDHAFPVQRVVRRGAREAAYAASVAAAADTRTSLRMGAAVLNGALHPAVSRVAATG